MCDCEQDIDQNCLPCPEPLPCEAGDCNPAPYVEIPAEVVIASEQELPDQMCCLPEEEQKPCLIGIAGIVDNGTTVEIFVTNARGPVEYSNDGTTWQASSIFTAVSESAVTYYAREKNNPGCVVSRSYENYCIPSWRILEPKQYQCKDLIRQVKQVDGCGNERWIEDPTGWTDTDDIRCV